MIQDNDKQLTALIAVVVVIIVLVGFFVFWLLQRETVSDTAPVTFQEQQVTVPVTQTPSESDVLIVSSETVGATSSPSVVRPAPVLDWRDDVLEVVSVTQTEQVYNEVVPTTVTAVPEETADSYQIEIPEYVPYTFIPSEVPDDITPPVPEETERFAGLAYYDMSTTRNCGVFQVPADGVLSEDELAKDTTSVCMGRAVAGGCRNVRATVVSDGQYPSAVSVIRRDDGVCSLGLEQDGALALCSIHYMMNTYVSYEESFAEWQAVFSRQPGDAFAALVLRAAVSLTPAMFDTLDCQTYRM